MLDKTLKQKATLYSELGDSFVEFKFCRLFSSNDAAPEHVDESVKSKTYKQTWLEYELKIVSAGKELEFKSKDKKLTTFTGMVSSVGKFMLAIEPGNEIEQLQNLILKYLKSSTQEPETPPFIFEPSEPSFELQMDKNMHDASAQVYKVFFWVDSGNTKELEYSWDSLGIRFTSTKDQLERFANQLAIDY